MSEAISQTVIDALRRELEAHPIYGAIESLPQLRVFMQHHVYSVWDFMSLIKHLQNLVAPARVPWRPAGDTLVRRFINELGLEEESDIGLAAADQGESFVSHFELYCAAMREVGADDGPVQQFVQRAAEHGIRYALTNLSIPKPSRKFTTTTFDFIDTGKPHVAAAALALGREHIIPAMFRRLLQNVGVSAAQAPMFHYYLNRHIHLDEDFHAPLSLRLLNGLCGSDRNKIAEATDAATAAVRARIQFWDGVLDAIKGAKQA